MTARACHLVIFARRPQLGIGKRRLAADVGDVEALRFARGALDRLVRSLGRDPRWRLWLAVTPDRPLDWVPAGTALPQGTGDLGQRRTDHVCHLACYPRTQRSEPDKSMVNTPHMISTMPAIISGVRRSENKNRPATATSATPHAVHMP